MIGSATFSAKVALPENKKLGGLHRQLEGK
jgi:hypothetical protein